MRYLNYERSLVLLGIDFVTENQDEIARTVKKLSALMLARNIQLSKAKEVHSDFLSILNRELKQKLK